MIKSIVVSTKPFVLVPGMKVWSNFGYIREHEIASDVYRSTAYIDKIDTLTKFTLWGKEETRKSNIFPGDLGMPGYKYDDRPCVLFRSRLAAEAAHEVYGKWLDEHRAKQTHSRFIDYIC